MSNELETIIAILRESLRYIPDDVPISYNTHLRESLQLAIRTAEEMNELQATNEVLALATALMTTHGSWLKTCLTARVVELWAEAKWQAEVMLLRGPMQVEPQRVQGAGAIVQTDSASKEEQ